MILSFSKTPSIRSLLSQFASQAIRNTAATTAAGVPTTVSSVPFSTKTNAKKTKPTLQSYNEEKQRAKEYRTKLYNKRQERIRSLPHRRPKAIKDLSELIPANENGGEGPPKYKRGMKKAQFRNWFDAKRQSELYYNRLAKRQGQEWKVKVGIMIERLPIVTMDREGWEEDYMYLAAQLERETAIIYPKEIQGFDNPMDSEVLTMEELLEHLPEGLKPAPRITEEDTHNIIQSTNRKLSQRVYLSIRPDDEIGWSLPIVTLNEGKAENESFVDCIKQYVKSNTMMKDLKLIYLSNCPMAVDVIPYSSEDGDKDDERSKGGKYFGEKVFYMRVQYEEGAVDGDKASSKLDNWGWLERSEIVERVNAEKGKEASLFYHYML